MSKKSQAWIPIAIVVVVAVTTSSALAQLPNPGMTIDPANTALVITDPQIDFLSPDGVTWGVVGKSVEANNTVQNIETLFQVAKANGIQVFISPHYYYPSDHDWHFEGAMEVLQLPELDGYAAALVNYRFIANAVWTTQEMKALLQKGQS